MIKNSMALISDTMSVQDLLSDQIGKAEGQLLRDFTADYGADGEFPTDEDFVDFTTLTFGPDTYLYAGDQDYECSSDITDRIDAELPLVKRTYRY